jgi:hypothetical protein
MRPTTNFCLLEGGLTSHDEVGGAGGGEDVIEEQGVLYAFEGERVSEELPALELELGFELESRDEYGCHRTLVRVADGARWASEWREACI